MHANLVAEVFGVDGLIVIAVIAVILLFGGSRLPKLARGLGSASHEFKKGIEEGNKELADSSTSTTPTIADQSSEKTSS